LIEGWWTNLDSRAGVVCLFLSQIDLKSELALEEEEQ
jgi:hypothetical protein